MLEERRPHGAMYAAAANSRAAMMHHPGVFGSQRIIFVVTQLNKIKVM
jgi:hypothetical protein